MKIESKKQEGCVQFFQLGSYGGFLERVRIKVGDGGWSV